MSEESSIKYYSIAESEIGYTTQELPEGSVEISLDSYISLKAELEASIEEFAESLESS